MSGVGKQPPRNDKGVYLPPHRLRELAEARSAEGDAVTQQRAQWMLLQRGITGIINRANAANLDRIVYELLSHDLLWGKGLLVRALLRAQAAAPAFTPVFAALVCVINSKMPEIAELLLVRLLLVLQRSLTSGDRSGCSAAACFLAHLLNQQVVHEFIGLQLLVLLLERGDADAVELACGFLLEAGCELSLAAPAGLAVVFERLKALLQEDGLGPRTRFVIEEAFAARRAAFADRPAVAPGLDLIAHEDKITHRLTLDATDLDAQEELDAFSFDAEREAHVREWAEIQQEIIGTAAEEEAPEQPAPPQDMTAAETKRLREGIYLRIMNSVEHEEAAHKLIKMALPEEQLEQLCNMVVDCCAEERSFLTYYGLLGLRLCAADVRLQQVFLKVFVDRYAGIFDLDTQRVRKLARFFAFLLAGDGIDWHALACIRLSEDETTSSTRIFLKVLFQEIAHQLGTEGLSTRLLDEDNAQATAGLFPRDDPDQLAFALDFFTVIGLGAAVEPLRALLPEPGA